MNILCTKNPTSVLLLHFTFFISVSLLMLCSQPRMPIYPPTIHSVHRYISFKIYLSFLGILLCNILDVPPLWSSVDPNKYTCIPFSSFWWCVCPFYLIRTPWNLRCTLSAFISSACNTVSKNYSHSLVLKQKIHKGKHWSSQTLTILGDSTSSENWSFSHEYDSQRTKAAGNIFSCVKEILRRPTLRRQMLFDKGCEIGFAALSNSAWHRDHSAKAGWISWARAHCAVIIQKLILVLKTYGASSDLSWEKLVRKRNCWRVEISPNRSGKDGGALASFLGELRLPVHGPYAEPESGFSSNKDCLQLQDLMFPQRATAWSTPRCTLLENTASEKWLSISKKRVYFYSSWFRSCKLAHSERVLFFQFSSCMQYLFQGEQMAEHVVMEEMLTVSGLTCWRGVCSEADNLKWATSWKFSLYAPYNLLFHYNELNLSQ